MHFEKPIYIIAHILKDKDKMTRRANSVAKTVMNKIQKLAIHARQFGTQRSFATYGFTGNYSDWNTVRGLCRGYDDKLIIEKVLGATKDVVSGKKKYERDSVTFDEIQYSWPLLSGLLMSATKNKGLLSVLDFGGALGSTYFQNRDALAVCHKVDWTVVEQPHFVEIGQREIANDSLHFCFSIQEAQDLYSPQVLVLSSVLQYLENPWLFLTESVLTQDFEMIIIDRTAINRSNQDRLTMQRVPPSIYSAEYPAWFFSEEKLLGLFKQKYDLLASFPAYVGDRTYIDGIECAGDRGYILLRKGR